MTIALDGKVPDFIYIPKGPALSAIECLKPSCRIIGLTMGQFSLIDLVHEVLKKIGGGNLIISTWSSGIKDVNTIAWMVSTDLIKDMLLITDHSFVNRQKKYALQIEDLFAPENIRTSDIHAKFVLIQNENYHISIITSMNLTENKTCETFEINDNAEIFNFYYKFAMSIAKEMPKGFVADSKVVTQALKRAFNSQVDQFGWQDKW